jgi:NAD(P)-dependent dehydrogenase (short-subunit alcohol dehydrogenase family)
MRKLAGLTAVVTGSSSGIGRQIARELAREGASIVCCDQRRSPREGGYEVDIDIDTDVAIVNDGGNSIFVETDVSDSNALRFATDQAINMYGKLDIMVNNAGVWFGHRLILDETEDEYDATMRINAKGVWLGCKHAIEAMVSLGRGGSIVNIASIAGLVGLEREPAYCASKGAVIALTRQLALDYGRNDIRVNAVCPGFVETGLARSAFGVNPEHLLTPSPRLGTVQDVAAAVVFLASPGAKWINGSILSIDGGYTAR